MKSNVSMGVVVGVIAVVLVVVIFFGVKTMKGSSGGEAPKLPMAVGFGPPTASNAPGGAGFGASGGMRPGSGPPQPVNMGAPMLGAPPPGR